MSYLLKVKAQVSAGFKTALAYRFDFFVTLFTAPISLIIYYFLWKSIFEYSGATVINGFTFSAMVSYYVLNMIVGFFTWSDVEKWMQHDILRGELVFELLKPIRHISCAMCFEGGINLLAIIIQAIPILAVAIVFFAMPAASIVNFLLFVLALVMAYLIYFMISYIIGVAAFWLKRIDGLHRAKKPIITFLAGGLIPLTFFPENVQAVLKYLPFQYVRFIPINIYLGQYAVMEALQFIGIAAVWVIGLYVVIRLMWKKAMDKFTGAGV
ncbi:ABC-2 family transporter protein [Candidatus Woesearchaeota archaeon]|nr:ABC-2 family transporter protein [Candidatus Woesearchaeota archaeon]